MLSSIPTKRDGRHRFARSRWLRHLFLSSSLALVLIIVTMLAAMIAIDAGIADRMIAGWASRKLGRDVHIDGLQAELLSSRPHLTISRLTISNPTWAGHGNLASVTDISAQIQPWSILSGTMRIPELTIGKLDLHLIRDKAGRNNWTLGEASPGQAAFGFLKATDRLGIADGHVDLRDLQNSFQFAGAFNHDPSVAAALTLSGSGDLKGGEVTLTAKGGALNGKAVGRPYPFKARIIDGATVVNARGHSGQPFDLSTYSLSMVLCGPNLADLTYLFDLQTPNSAPYAISVNASANGPMVTLTDLQGRVAAATFADGSSPIKVGPTIASRPISCSADGPRRTSKPRSPTRRRGRWRAVHRGHRREHAIAAGWCPMSVFLPTSPVSRCRFDAAYCRTYRLCRAADARPGACCTRSRRPGILRNCRQNLWRKPVWYGAPKHPNAYAAGQDQGRFTRGRTRRDPSALPASDFGEVGRERRSGRKWRVAP